MKDNSNLMLDIRGLRKHFGRTEALKGIDISIGSPGVYGFLGPNGAGKTTTFKSISTLIKPSAGNILIGGFDVRNERSEALSLLGVQFDSPSFYPYLSGRQNLAAKLMLYGDQGGTIDIERLLKISGLGKSAEKPFGEYSWGMKQRLSLAASLANDPKLLLLDEPTNGLDPAGIAYIRDLLPRLAREDGRAILLSSHRMEEVQEICDEVIIIHEGTILARGSIDDLTSSKIIEIVCSDYERALKILDNLDDVYSVKHCNNTIIISTGLDVESIKDHLGRESITVEAVSERGESLEDVFLRLTGTESNDG